MMDNTAHTIASNWTRLCDAVYALADGSDLLVIEATFLTQDAELADRYGP